VTKNSNYKVKLPTQFRTKKSTKKKVLKKEGDKLNLSIKKCVICNKKKMENYDIKDSKGELVRINKCKNCNFLNASTISVYKPEYPHTVTYYNPPSLEDKQSK
jgi:hypothetical protein